MKKSLKLLAALFILSLLFVGCDNEDDPIVDNGDKAVKIEKKNDKALLLCTFGSTFEAPHQTYKGMVAKFKKEFPGMDVYLSFTSTTCITRWGAKTKEYYTTPDHWLKAIGKAGYKKVMVQSLHVIPGEEYLMLRDYYVKKFKKEHEDISVVVGDPLLVSDRDIKEVAEVLYNAFKPRLDKGEAVAFLGHGNPENSYSSANMSYHRIKDYMQQNLDKKMFVGTVDCEDMLLDYVMDDMSKVIKEGTTVNLTPLMSIAGDHANNDMAGDYDKDESDEDQSWKVQLKKAGYQIEDENCVLKGLGDYPEIVNIWVRHLKEAMSAE